MLSISCASRRHGARAIRVDESILSTNAVRLATTFFVLQTFPLDIHGGMPRDGMS
jgi:hypothetical protein